MKPELNPREKLFVEEYLKDLNPGEAARRAGYAAKSGQKITSLRSMGCNLRKRPHVAEAIDRAIAQRAERQAVKQDRVLEELARIAFADLRVAAVWGPEGLSLKPSAEMNPEQASAVSEVSARPVKDGVASKVKLHDKVRALELLGKHLGLFSEKVDAQVDGELVISWKK